MSIDIEVFKDFFKLCDLHYNDQKQINTTLEGFDDPHIYYPKRPSKPLFQGLVSQCEKMGLPFIHELPEVSELDKNYDLIVDGLFGFSFAPPVRPAFEATMHSVSFSPIFFCRPILFNLTFNFIS